MGLEAKFFTVYPNDGAVHLQPFRFLAIFFVFFFGVLGSMVYCWCNPNSYHRRMMRLQERAMEAQIRHIENAPPGTVFPIYDYGRGQMRNRMMGNSQLMINPNTPMQQMSAYTNPMMTDGVAMPPSYCVTVNPPIQQQPIALQINDNLGNKTTVTHE